MEDPVLMYPKSQKWLAIKLCLECNCQGTLTSHPLVIKMSSASEGHASLLRSVIICHSHVQLLLNPC